MLGSWDTKVELHSCFIDTIFLIVLGGMIGTWWMHCVLVLCIMTIYTNLEYQSNSGKLWNLILMYEYLIESFYMYTYTHQESYERKSNGSTYGSVENKHHEARAMGREEEGVSDHYVSSSCCHELITVFFEWESYGTYEIILCICLLGHMSRTLNHFNLSEVA